MTKNYFECLGLKYFGPIDGHDRELLELVFEQAKRKKRPCLVHVVTQKGKGYSFAEEKSDVFHSVGGFDKESGKTPEPKYDFSAAFGDALARLADENKDIVAVTAAMEGGTGLSRFSAKHKDRFFDVGIAEEHAVTFCAGMAAMGKKAVFAVYSSFLQRCYDQLLHDVAIQKLPIILGVDRAGLVPGDGMTHQGIYDSAFLMSIPEFNVYTPEDYADLEDALGDAVKCNQPCAVRYPRGCEMVYDRSSFLREGDISVCDIGEGEKSVAVITYGRITANVFAAAELLSGYKVRIIKLHKIKPVDFDALFEQCAEYEKIFVFEEGIRDGGFGTIASAEFGARGKSIFVHAIDPEKGFSGNIDQLFDLYGFTPEKISQALKNI